MGVRKADCSPEEWTRHLAWQRDYYTANKEKYNVKKYRTPERRARYNAAQKERMRRNPALRKRAVDLIRQRKYGFAPGMVDALLRLQNGKCAICFRAFDGGAMRPQADHCHDQKHPRGLLCRHCNQAEGVIKRTGVSPADFGTRLARYLAAPPAREWANRRAP